MSARKPENNSDKRVTRNLPAPDDGRVRCAWATGDSVDLIYRDYHDLEWGVPVRDDRRLFEFLVLEGAQAGLSWRTVLGKRENYRRAFHGFDIARVAAMRDRELESLLDDPGLIRNRLKILSARSNARASLAVIEEVGSLEAWLWSFVGGEPLLNRWTAHDKVPATSAHSDAMSKAMRKRGFSFVGSTICYAFMQATGMVNDHLTCCFRFPGKPAPGKGKRT
ncbi:DNA-3-methyladenine glycosylase I [Dokdonella immobilis]|uniref:DNA-3-methyladenine glycosylase I n=1 Tax=Dokdonella immobilis TaxID=578942 RepID=A0A1I4VLA8_9GAMM|nr:DNA-3-methyladenine glycosylase I [Dokdonella immobilis]SFN01940.1 DNA-3-methyladenine glycosylase I [Dokdonella immobilis]